MAICTTCNLKTDDCNWQGKCRYKETDEYISMVNRAKETDFNTWNFSEEINHGRAGEHFTNMPSNLSSIEISDGIIIDSGYVIGNNFYLYNFHRFICDKATNGKFGHYWRYKN